MVNLKTNYLGLELKNPIVIGACNLVSDPENLEKLEHAGAAAIVYKSLFEEQVQLEAYELEHAHQIHSDWSQEHKGMFPPLMHAGPKEHLLKLKRAKEVLRIPLIGSLNAVMNDTWVEYAKKMEDTGIDAIELNFYAHDVSFDTDAQLIVEKQIGILENIRSEIRIPIAVKLSPFYTNILSVVSDMDRSGADGFVLFNRFFQPDIDIEKEEHLYPYNFSSANDNRLALRYAGLLYGKIKGTICSSNGVFSGADTIKMLLAGADAVQVVSAIYKKGINHIETMLEEIEEWMKKKHYHSIDYFKGKLSKQKLSDPFAYKRAQYVDILMKSDIFMQYHPKEGEFYGSGDEL